MNEQELAYVKKLISEGFSEKEAYDELMRQRGEAEQIAAVEDPGISSEAVMAGLSNLLKRSEKPGGVVRSKIAQGLEAVTGKDVYNPEEEKLASEYKIPYPGTSDIMERAGILVNDPFYARTALGFVGDVATDPLTYTPAFLAKIAKYLNTSVPVVAKLLRGAANVSAPVSSTIGAGGKGLYKSAFSNMDKKILASSPGAKTVSEVALEEASKKGGLKNIPAAWSKEGLRVELNSLADRIKATVDDILERAQKSGAKVDPDEIRRARDAYTQKLRSSALSDDLAKADFVDKEFARLLNDLGFSTGYETAALKPKAGPIVGTYAKTSKAQSAGKGAYKEFGHDPSFLSELEKRQASGIQHGVESGVSKIESDTGKSLVKKGESEVLAKENERLGALLEAQKQAAIDAAYAKNPISKGDVASVASQMSGVGTNFYNPKIIGAKKLYDIGSFGSATKLGKGAMRFGSKSILDPAGVAGLYLDSGLWKSLKNPFIQEEEYIPQEGQ